MIAACCHCQSAVLGLLESSECSGAKKQSFFGCDTISSKSEKLKLKGYNLLQYSPFLLIANIRKNKIEFFFWHIWIL